MQTVTKLADIVLKAHYVYLMFVTQQHQICSVSVSRHFSFAGVGIEGELETFSKIFQSEQQQFEQARRFLPKRAARVRFQIV